MARLPDSAAVDRIATMCAATVADVRTLRLELLGEIRRVVGFDAYAWLLTDPETSVGSAPPADVPCLPELPTLIRLKYLTALNRWTGLPPGGVATLVTATGGDRSRSRLWRELLAAYQVVDVASTVFRDRWGCWGFLDLWRVGGSSAFTTMEAAFLAGHRAGVPAGAAPDLRPLLRADRARGRAAAPPLLRRRHPGAGPTDERSEHTVQDHLKSIFAKTGTGSRRDLLARTLGG